MDRNYRSVFTFSDRVRLWSDLTLDSIRLGWFSGGISNPIACGDTNQHQDKPDRFYWYVKNTGSTVRARGIVTQGGTVLVTSDWHNITNDGNEFQIGIDAGNWWPDNKWVVAYVETDSGVQTNSCGFQATGGSSPDSGGTNTPPPVSKTLELGNVYVRSSMGEIQREFCGSNNGVDVPAAVRVQLTNKSNDSMNVQAEAKVGGKVVGYSGSGTLGPGNGANFDIEVQDWWPTDGTVTLYGKRTDISGIYSNSCNLHALIPGRPPPTKSDCASTGQKYSSSLPCCTGLYSCGGTCSSSLCPCVHDGHSLTGDDAKCCSGLSVCDNVCRTRCCTPEHLPPTKGEDCCSGLGLCDGTCEKGCTNTIIPPPSGTKPTKPQKPQEPTDKVPCDSNANCSWDQFCTPSGCSLVDCNSTKPVNSGMLTFCQNGSWTDFGRHEIAGLPTIYVVGGVLGLALLVRLMRKKKPVE